MNEPLTVRDVMTRTYVGVNEGDPVAGVAELMRDEGVNSAVVLRGREPIGMVSARDVVALVADRRDPDGTPVGDVMARPAVSIEAGRSLSEAVSAITNSDARRMVVMEGDEVVGMLSEHDIVAAHAERPAAPLDREPSSGVEATEAPSASAIESEVYTTQGVCEVCGSLARDLSNHNGQLVCADCVDM